jgi:hypothetical protein
MCKQAEGRCVGGSGAQAASLAHPDSDKLIDTAASSRQLLPFPSPDDVRPLERLVISVCICLGTPRICMWLGTDSLV